MPLQAPNEPKKYTTVYGDFRGVDFTNDATNVWKRRSPTGLNMTPDMSGRPWKRTGWNIEVTEDDFKTAYYNNLKEQALENIKILNVYSFELAGQDHLIIFCNIGVFAYTNNELKHLLTDEDITGNSNRGFFFEGQGNAGFYFYGGFKMYGYVYEDDFVCKEITPYIPKTLIGRTPNGGGTVYESINLLSGLRTESFAGDGSSKEYFLSSDIISAHDVVVKVLNEDGVIETLKPNIDYTVGSNSIEFFSAPRKSTVDNVMITYPVTSSNIIQTDYFTIEAQIKTTSPPPTGAVPINRELSQTILKDKATGKYHAPLSVEYLFVPPGTAGSTTAEPTWWDARRLEEDYQGVGASMYRNGQSDGKTIYFYQRYTPGTPFQIADKSPNVRVRYAIEKSYKTNEEKAFFNTKANANYGNGLINSVFVGGSDYNDYASRVWYSQVADPTYFPQTNYFEAGSNDTKIMGLTKVGEYLGIIKQGNAMDSTIYLAYPVNFDDDTTYAVKQSVNGIGAISRNCFDVLGDETLFLSNEGVMAIEPSQNENERQTKNRSYYINKKLLKESELSKAFSFIWKGLYILCVNSHCYILDGAQKTSWANEKTNLQYECYYWENVPAVCFAQYNNDLWFADNSGNLCRFKTYEKDGMAAYNDNGMAIPCEWSTILDNDGATNFFKNLQKKGCLVTILPMDKTSAKILLRADDKELIEVGEIVSENAKVPQEFYLNKKVKKYKRLQIIVKNEALDEGLGIQEIVKIYTMGNYSKNRSVNNGT